MSVLVTGVAGFIGYYVAEALLLRGEHVIGVDDLNDYYDVALKQSRLQRLEAYADFSFTKLDIADGDAMAALKSRHSDLDSIVHLAAQAGVRYSLENPRAYVRSNLVGQIEILELARSIGNLRHLVYASSSSVYGSSLALPFGLEDRCDQPQSLYAATKRADELMCYSYSHLYGIPATGLRFFTVYGPWGRPDMAPMLFASAIFAGRPIRLFNAGEMARDFTYIDDIVAGIVSAFDNPPDAVPPHRVFNLGNHRAEPLLRFIAVLEQACGLEAEKILEKMQPGDVPATYADISASQEALGFMPATSIDVGIPKFIEWYRSYYQS